MSRGATLAAVAALAVAGLLALWALAPAAAAQGCALAGVAALLAPVGAVSLRLTHRLTGGAWGDALAPLGPACLPLIVGAGAALALSALRLDAVFPWAAQPNPADALHPVYASTPFLLLRTAAAVVGWLLFATIADRPFSAATAAIGLVCHAVGVTILAVDWILALAPGFGSTAAGLALAAQQIMTALGLVALAGPQARVRGDVAKLLLAAVLGLVYLDFMTYLVFWYGDLPVRAAWYGIRGHGPWFVVLLASLACAAAALAMLLLPAAHRGGMALRVAGALALAASALHLLWLTAPSHLPAAALAAALALTAIGAAGLAAALRGVESDRETADA